MLFLHRRDKYWRSEHLIIPQRKEKNTKKGRAQSPTVCQPVLLHSERDSGKSKCWFLGLGKLGASTSSCLFLSLKIFCLLFLLILWEHGCGEGLDRGRDWVQEGQIILVLCYLMKSGPGIRWTQVREQVTDCLCWQAGGDCQRVILWSEGFPRTDFLLVCPTPFSPVECQGTRAHTVTGAAVQSSVHSWNEV